MDFANLKSLTILEGDVQEIYSGNVLLWKGGYTNQVPISTEIAGGTTIFNSGKGYREGYRLSSSGAEKSQSGAVVTGFIPAKRGDIIRMKGATWGTTVSEGYCYIVAYGTNGGKLYHANKHMNSTINNNISNQVGVDLSNSSIITDSNGVTTFNIVWTGSTEIAYIRISATGNGADMIVTINEEIE